MTWGKASTFICIKYLFGRTLTTRFCEGTAPLRPGDPLVVFKVSALCAVADRTAPLLRANDCAGPRGGIS